MPCVTDAFAEHPFVYHVYALGACGAPAVDDPAAAPVPRLEEVTDRLDHFASLGVTGLLVGPVMQSATHGYDVVDSLAVDRRLGDDETLRTLSRECSALGMRLLLDAVLNHVGRGFFAFQDVLAHGPDSAYAGWFHLRPGETTPFGDPFGYEAWAGNYELVKLDVDHPSVREYLFTAVGHWFREFGIGGLRLDAADVLSDDFLRALGDHVRSLRADAWLVGEMVRGDYGRMCRNGIDAATNYELYKGLWSSHKDRNYFEVAHTLQRQYGPGGIYEGQRHQTFADNHDVDRVASSVEDPAHLFPLYGLVFTVPGVPSVYYGSEWGARGARTSTSDDALRPALDRMRPERPDLAAAVMRLAAVRESLPALRSGTYDQVSVASLQLAFRRGHEAGDVVVAVNADASPSRVRVDLPAGRYRDALNDSEVDVEHGLVEVPPTWLRVLTV